MIVDVSKHGFLKGRHIVSDRHFFFIKFKQKYMFDNSKKNNNN